MPVIRQQQIGLTYEVQNAPASLREQGIDVQLSHQQITLIGSRTALEQIGQTVANLGVINFDVLRAQQNTVVFPLTVSNAVRIEPNIEQVTATVDLSQYTERVFSVPSANAKFTGDYVAPPGTRLSIGAMHLQNVVVCGPAAALEARTADDLQLQIHVPATLTTTTQATVRVQITGAAADSCWVYYGSNGYSLPVTVQ